MDVGVDAPGREDVSFPGDRFGARAHHDRHPGLGVGVPGFADADDAAVLQTNIGFDDAPPVEDQGIGDHCVDGTAGSRGLGLAHAVADHLAAAELHLVRRRTVKSFSTSRISSVSARRSLSPVVGAVGLGVGLAGNAIGHGSGVEGSVDLAVETDHASVTGKGNQVHVSAVTRFEADGGASGDIEPLTARGSAVELQGSVGFCKVEVGPHLARGGRRCWRRGGG